MEVKIMNSLVKFSCLTRHLDEAAPPLPLSFQKFCRILLLWTWMRCISISTSWKLFWCEALFIITLKQKILMIFISDIYVWEIQFLYFHLIYLKVPMLVNNNALDVLSIGRQKHGPLNSSCRYELFAI